MKGDCLKEPVPDGDDTYTERTLSTETVPQVDASKLPHLDLHSVPPSSQCEKDGQRRFIFRHWPRDPNGKPIPRDTDPEPTPGKKAGNGLVHWGATLYDFYHVRRAPLVSDEKDIISTGSTLSKMMETFGELEHAKDETSRASREADPKEIPARDPAKDIVDRERRVHDSIVVHDNVDRSPNHSDGAHQTDEELSGHPIGTGKDEAEESKDDAKNVNLADVNGVETQHAPREVPIESPFHPSHYPSPWPLVPFESPCPPPRLQKRLPIHLLPKKLYVHDPWDILDREESQSSNSDMRTYSLSLPQEWEERTDAASKAAATAEEEVPEVLVFPGVTEGPTEVPVIAATLPRRPPKLTNVSEAHLYLPQKGKLGSGNHSIVYNAELELPRDLFCESTYCESCLDEQIKANVELLKHSGKWAQMMNEAAKKYDDTMERDTSSSTSSKIRPRYVGNFKVTLEHTPMETMSLKSESKLEGDTSSRLDVDTVLGVLSKAQVNRRVAYEGLIIRIHANIQWQNPSYPDTICEHQVNKVHPVPKTATFQVAAKISRPYDRFHSKQEAENYLEFPSHLFEHWNGYNVIPPLREPTPVGAVVPQFFGYYTPDDPLLGPNPWRFWKSILLIEHCGEQICVNDLSVDDRRECAALLFRFHYAGWLHMSIGERNILMQKEHPTCDPMEDRDACVIPHRHRPHSFRLIDFGRSVYTEHESVWRLTEEERQVKRLFYMRASFSGE